MKIVAIQIESAVGRCIFQDVVEGVVGLGHEVFEFTKGMSQDRELIKKIAEFKPDLLFTINHQGIGKRMTKTLTRRGLPYASWFVDDPTIRLKREYISPYCVIFVWDREYLNLLNEMGFKYAYYLLPMATNTKVFKKLNLTPQDKERYTSNLSFAGFSFYNYYEGCYKERQDSRAQRVLNEVILRQAKNPLLSISKIFDDVQEEFQSPLFFPNLDEKLSLLGYLEAAGMALYRIEILKEVCSLGLSLAGDNGWRDSLSRVDWNGRIRFLGWLDNRTELPKLYNATKVNLNITQSQSRSALNMRVFDIAACGAFMLTDYRSDLEELFGRETTKLISYIDKYDLRDKAVYYLNHSEEREEIGRRLKERILKGHTYKDRMKELVEIMEATFNL